ncbi:MAG: HD domain-containing protein [Candidatus Heimdallarchaeota archaeon]|nr:HD domain-containing protein [Candidatus Heimdallarchaeota archaeon]
MFEKFYASLSTYDVDKQLLKSVYIFSRDRHAGQTRKNLVPYFTHPVRVSQKLKNYGTEVIAAGLLHDVVEDTETKIDEIRSLFGEEIALLVEGVTKNGKDLFGPLLRIADKDPRVFLIKLADRLDNLEDGILNMGDTTKARYLTETPDLLLKAKEYNITEFSDAINHQLDLLRKSMNT